MEQAIRHDELEHALQGCGASWNASQTHGLLSGRLAISGANAGFDWLAQVLEGANFSAAPRDDCEAMLRALFESTYRSLSERLSEFEPLLPDSEDPARARAGALGHWCEGYLHGLVSSQHDDALKRKLAVNPLAEIITDMLQMTRAAAEEDDSRDIDEDAYMELVEYLRVAAQLAYEELVDFRLPAGDDDQPSGAEEVLH